MLEKEIEKEIYKKLDMFNEGLRYTIESMNELQGGLHLISYLLHLHNKKVD